MGTRGWPRVAGHAGRVSEQAMIKKREGNILVLWPWLRLIIISTHCDFKPSLSRHRRNVVGVGGEVRLLRTAAAKKSPRQLCEGSR